MSFKKTLEYFFRINLDKFNQKIFDKDKIVECSRNPKWRRAKTIERVERATLIIKYTFDLANLPTQCKIHFHNCLSTLLSQNWQKYSDEKQSTMPKY